MGINTKLGIAVVQLRKDQGISQYDFARKANITFRYLSDIENGKRNVSMEILEKIAVALEIQPSKIMQLAESYN